MHSNLYCGYCVIRWNGNVSFIECSGMGMCPLFNVVEWECVLYWNGNVSFIECSGMGMCPLLNVVEWECVLY
jgi:hypothetical protein